jgi:acetolactate synthase-1/2/3 large subunit
MAIGLYLGNISDLMGRAFSKLRNGRRRPVLLEVPSDLSWEQVENSKLEYEPVRTHTSAGDPGDVAKAICMLLQAKRPIFYVGQEFCGPMRRGSSWN